jgi:hypothetical protein
MKFPAVVVAGTAFSILLCAQEPAAKIDPKLLQEYFRIALDLAHRPAK